MATGEPIKILIYLVLAVVIVIIFLNILGINIVDFFKGGSQIDYQKEKSLCCISFTTVARLCDSEGEAVTNYECTVGGKKITIAELAKKVGGQGTSDGVKKACGCLSTTR